MAGQIPPNVGEMILEMLRQINESDEFFELVSAIQEGREPEASGVNVRRTMQALEAAKLSIASGRIVDTDDLG